MDGLDLMRFLIETSGLPQDSLAKELNKLLSKSGYDPQGLTLEQVREVLGDYLQDALLEAKAAQNP